MNVGLAIESDRAVEHLVPAAVGITNALEAYFGDRQYGPDVIEIIIGLILMTGSVSERLHPVRPFAYRRFATERSRITGGIVEIHKSASWDVRPDFAVFSGQSLQGARDYLCGVLLASTAVLQEHQSEYPDFDVPGFRADFETCLRAHCGKPEA
jgi:hypothetical protein